MKMCILSNGHGEDSIALTIINAFQNHNPSIEWIICPLVGKGHSYTSNNHPTLFHNPTFPSGGFIRTIKDLLSDIREGLIQHLFFQRREIRKVCKESDIVIAVGDFFCLWMAAQSNQPLFFLPTAKSDTFMPHSFFEIAAMKRWCTHVFPRDQITANSLSSHNVPTTYCGNVMMDNLITTDPIPGFIPSQKPLIGILPGSRDEAYENMKHICLIIDELGAGYDFVLARSESLSESQLNAIIGTRPIQISTHFKAVINRADIIIGLSGTGNEQAAYLGKPVICFEGTGPQTTATRFREQRKLMGDAIHFIEDSSPKIIASAIQNLQKSEQKEIVKTPSASEEIAHIILNIACKY